MASTTFDKPLGTEIETLNIKLPSFLLSRSWTSSGSSREITIPDGRIFVATALSDDGNASHKSFLAVGCCTSNTVYVLYYQSTGGITITSNSNKITIDAGATYGSYMSVFVI